MGKYIMDVFILLMIVILWRINTSSNKNYDISRIDGWLEIIVVLLAWIAIKL